MRKLFTCIMMLCGVLFLNAQVRTSEPSAPNHFKPYSTNEKFIFNNFRGDTYRLTERLSSDRYEVKHFWYDQNDRVIAIKDSAGDPTYGTVQVIDSMTYDAQNRVTRVDGYQKLNGVWKHVYYVNYVYDVDGNLVERTNFNSFGSDSFEQGGIYEYVYENGRRVSHEMYFGDHAALGERCFYQYDAQGRLASETYLQGYFSIDTTMKITYAYDAAGRKTDLRYFYYDEPNWEADRWETFFYDAAGNCVEHSVKNAQGQYTDRRFYDYNATIQASEVSMPYYIPEMMLPEAYDDANMRVLEHWYTLDVDYVLQYICDYAYLYNGVFMSVEDRETPTVSVAPNPTSGLLKVNAEGRVMQSASLYDLSGRLINTYVVNDATASIDMSQVSAGIYVLKMLLEDGSPVVKKVIKQ